MDKIFCGCKIETVKQNRPASDVRSGDRHAVNRETVLQATNVYAYDLNGNLLSDGTRSFAYDDENQLVSVWKTNVWRSDFVYDGKMRRRIVKESTWNGSWVQTNELHYIYDGNVVVQERAANNLPLVTYTRGNDLSGTLQGAGGIGGLLARTDNSKLLVGDTFASAIYHADGNGNVTCLIYTNQTIAAKYLYDPYGNMLSMYCSLADANTYRFSSKEWNANSGLYYYLYRLYDANAQRWLNRDPIGEIGFEACRYWSASLLQGIGLMKQIADGDLYEFVRNQPIGGFDALGLASTGPGSIACMSATDQAEAAEKTYMADKTQQNLDAWMKAVMIMLAACKPPPPPPLVPPIPPNCPSSPPWGWHFVPPPPQAQKCAWTVVGGTVIMICIVILAPVGA